MSSVGCRVWPLRSRRIMYCASRRRFGMTSVKSSFSAVRLPARHCCKSRVMSPVVSGIPLQVVVQILTDRVDRGEAKVFLEFGGVFLLLALSGARRNA